MNWGLVRRIVLLCLGVRVILEVIGLVSLAMHDQSVGSQAVSMWSRWDAPHYLRIAEVGYKAGTPPPDDPLFIVFFPFFPVVVGLVSFVVRDMVMSGVLVSFAASVGACYFLHQLVTLDRDEDAGMRSVLLLLAFPTAYFLAAPYTEALFLFAVTASLYAARRGWWARAGLAGALATGTRVTGVALAPALAIEAWQSSDRMGTRVRRFTWVAVSGLGLLAYLAINQVVHGDPFHFLEVQRSHWFQHAVPPWEPIVEAVRAVRVARPGGEYLFIHIGRLVAFVFVVPMLVLGLWRMRVAHQVYAWAGLVLILSASWLISLPRYLLVMFPIFVVGADLTRSRRVLVPVIAIGSVLQGWLFWRYAVGEWTF